MTLLDEIETTLQTTATRLGPAVIGIGRGWESGSGAVIGRDRVLVSAHSAQRDEVAITFADGRRETAHRLGGGADVGIALLAAPTGELTPLEWATDEPVLGQAVLALASPGGRGLRATLGFVSSVRAPGESRRERGSAASIEHTAPLPRGSAGAPLLDRSGRLLGVNLVRTAAGLIVAAGGARLRERVESLGRGEAPRPVRLGVALAPPRAALELRRAVGLPERDGLLVRGVQEGSPADTAGLRRGDLIVAFAGQPTGDLDALHEALAQVAGPDPAEVAVVRGSDELRLPVVLGAPQ